MSYVFFDLEWNQGYPHSIEDKLDEIIQIGACRLEQWDSQPEPFSCYVRPTIHKKLHHRVRKMLPLDMDTLKQADGFRAVARMVRQHPGLFHLGQQRHPGAGYEPVLVWHGGISGAGDLRPPACL